MRSSRNFTIAFLAISIASAATAQSLPSDSAIFIRCTGELAMGEDRTRKQPFDQIFAFSEEDKKFYKYWPYVREFSDFCGSNDPCFVTFEENEISVSYSWEYPDKSEFTHSNLRLSVERYTGLMWQNVEHVKSQDWRSVISRKLVSRTDAVCKRVQDPRLEQRLF